MTAFRFTGLPCDGDPEALIGGRFGEWYQLPDRAPYQHRGVDMNVPTGTPVFNRANRTQRAINVYNPDGSFGIARALQDPETGLCHLYAHMSRSYVQPGEMVPPGATIGISGATGYVYGAHLHWQMDRQGVWSTRLQDNLDPLLYVHQEADMGMTPDEKQEFDALRGQLQDLQDKQARVERLVAGWGISVVITEPEARAMRERGHAGTLASPAEQTLTGLAALDLLDIRNASLFGGLLGQNVVLLDLKEGLIAAAADFDHYYEGSPRDASLSASFNLHLPLSVPG